MEKKYRSNLQGFHGGGAAAAALRHFGAVWGQGVGLQGQSYAIPTMQGGVETIRPYVEEFIRFARERRDLTFYVTRIGCGIAGFTDEEIAPLFADALGDENIVLPREFVEALRRYQGESQITKKPGGKKAAAGKPHELKEKRTLGVCRMPVFHVK